MSLDDTRLWQTIISSVAWFTFGCILLATGYRLLAKFISGAERIGPMNHKATLIMLQSELEKTKQSENYREAARLNKESAELREVE